MKRHRVITTGTVASHCHVTYETVKNWIKQGKLNAFETPGGHHRILVDDFKAFLETYGMPPYEIREEGVRRLLIVDDDEVIVKNVADFFGTDANYECAAASDGYEAGLQVMRFEPDMIILDLVMPNIDGFEVCRKIKSDPDTQHIKILVVTAHAEEGQKEKIMACGADDFLAKPFTFKELKERVEALFAPPPRAPRGGPRRKASAAK